MTYQGGRLLSSLRAARLAQEQSVLNYQTTLADTVLKVQVAYYDALLAVQRRGLPVGLVGNGRPASLRTRGQGYCRSNRMPAALSWYASVSS